ncbi:D-aminoacyl-tRNA deacylase [Patescibacteria group bacterium]
MRLVVQRVLNASVEVGGRVVGKTSKGLLVLVGVKKGDSKKDAKALAVKLAKLRVMADEKDKMNLSVRDVNAEVLVISQFTLHADTSGGNRPSFIQVEDPKAAKQIYEYFVQKLMGEGIKVKTGSFGDYMQIKTVLDGPVTILYSD